MPCSQGFSKSLFPYYLDASGSPRGGKGFAYSEAADGTFALLMPAVVAAAKLHYGCSTQNSAAIENEGGAGAWGKRMRRWRWWGAARARALLWLCRCHPFFLTSSIPFHIFTGTAGSHWEYRQYMVRRR